MEYIAKCLPDFAVIRKARTDYKFIRYARTKFPDISDALIKQNLCEIITAYDAELKCRSSCMGIDMCVELLNSAGYTYNMILQSNGWIKMEYRPCVFHSGKKNVAIIPKSKIIKNKVMIENG